MNQTSSDPFQVRVDTLVSYYGYLPSVQKPHKYTVDPASAGRPLNQ